MTARHAILALSSAQSVGNPSAAIAWDSAVVDTGGFFNSADPTRLTIGAKMSAVRIQGAAYMTSAVGEPGGIYIQKNGASFPGAAAQLYSFNGTVVLSVATPLIEVVEGDYFELFRGATSGQLEALDYTYFAIEAA